MRIHDDGISAFHSGGSSNQVSAEHRERRSPLLSSIATSDASLLRVEASFQQPCINCHLTGTHYFSVALCSIGSLLCPRLDIIPFAAPEKLPAATMERVFLNPARPFTPIWYAMLIRMSRRAGLHAFSAETIDGFASSYRLLYRRMTEATYHQHRAERRKV